MTSTHDANFYRDQSRDPIVIDRARGVYLYDHDGRELLDFGSGISVTSIGMGVDEVAQQIARQLEQASFVFNGYFTNAPRQALSVKLLAMCHEQMGGVVFVSSGSEANEVAIKLARQYHREAGRPGKYKVISRRKAYHGNTMLTASVSDRPSWTEPFEPYLAVFPKIAAPYCYRCPLGLEYPSCAVACAHELEDVIQKEGPDTVSAFIAEPIIGTTVPGVTPPDEYYAVIRETCDRHNIVFIADEVITGVGRAGRNFGMDHWSVPADITTVAKGLAAGYAPLSAVILHQRIIDAIRAGSNAHTQGFTYGGNPLSCAAGLAVLEYIEQHDLVNRAASIGRYLKERLEALRDEIDIIGDVRGRGLILGIEFVRDRKTKAPFPKSADLTRRIVRIAMENRLVLIGAMPGCADGENGDQLQISPAFVISEEQVDTAVGILRGAILQARDEVMKL